MADEMPDTPIETTEPAAGAASVPPESVGAPVPPAEPAEAGSTPESSSGAPEVEADDPTTPPEIRKLRKESAGYRTRLREAELERDALRGEIGALQLGQVERHARDQGLLDEALDDLLAATDVAELRGDDGQLDGERVKQLVTDLKTARPHWFGSLYPAVPHGAQPPPAPPADPFADALKRTARTGG